MSVNIKIPSLEASGETTSSIFTKIFLIARKVTDYLISDKGSYEVTDAVSFMLKVGDNFLNIAETFFDIARKRRDSNSAFALFRVQADYLATLLLIFEGKSEDEIRFRYLLYLLDGLSQRAESLQDIPQYNGYVSKDDYDALVKQMTDTKENALYVLDFCQMALNSHPYKQLNPNLFDKIVKHKQWKYKEFNNSLSKYEFYQWKDLYFLIDKRSDVASFISLCSHYVHGNVNSLLSDFGDDVFDPIVHFNAILIERYIEMLMNLYGREEINKIIK